MNIKVIVWQEEGVWCGSVPALPGCHTWGETYEELMEMLKEVIPAWLEVASEKAYIQEFNQKGRQVEISI